MATVMNERGQSIVSLKVQELVLLLCCFRMREIASLEIFQQKAED